MTAGEIAVLAVAAAAMQPFLLLGALGIPSMAGRPVGERVTGPLTRASFAAQFIAFAVAAIAMAVAGLHEVEVPLGEWFGNPEYHFRVKLLVDGLAMPMALLMSALVMVVAVFAHRYLHREPGYNRFFVLLALFGCGMTMIVLAGTVELVFAGWELVGLSSALLVAYFLDRPLPADNGLRTFAVYRACDVGLLVAAVLVHHFCGTGDLAAAVASDAWTQGRATLVAVLLVVTAMGKCAQLPFSWWLPRAMEGPTPSSAIFYGALSVHAGAFLLLRFGPVLEQAPAAEWMLIAVGTLTALHATMVGRAQSDVKCSIAYASLTQVSLVLVEIGFGLRTLPMIHMVGHACLRSLQYLRAPNVLHDLRHLEQAVGGRSPKRGEYLERVIPEGARRWLYRLSVERFHLEEILRRFVLSPFVGVLRWLDRAERRWIERAEGR